ncbi:MAG: agmatinase, partial [Burkholderiales bacterium]|nr:agmatinase [Burkholderiales bacterium]
MSDDWMMDRAFAATSPFGVGMENAFAGALSLFRRRYTKDTAGADVAIMGIPFDLAVSNRPGTRFGPRAIRAASAQLAWKGGAWRWGFDPFTRLHIVDTGDCEVDYTQPQRFPETLEARAADIISSGVKLLCLGGDHFVTYPLLKAHAARHGPLALIQFDSHSDTWRENEKGLNHGSMFFHAVQEGIIDPARSVQVGIRSGNPETHGITILDADYVADHSPAEIAARMREVVGDGPAYLTFDIDFLDPAYAPGTGTPVCGGPSTNTAERILCGLSGLNVVGMDVVEVSPSYDVGEITALAGATM